LFKNLRPQNGSGKFGYVRYDGWRYDGWLYDGWLYDGRWRPKEYISIPGGAESPDNRPRSEPESCFSNCNSIPFNRPAPPFPAVARNAAVSNNTHRRDVANLT
jgi:hypothetical protein